jgi:hypothetical protein
MKFAETTLLHFLWRYKSNAFAQLLLHKKKQEETGIKRNKQKKKEK